MRSHFRAAFNQFRSPKYLHVISRSLLHHRFWTSIRWLDLALWLFSVLPIAGQHENLEVCASSRKQKVLRADDLQTSALGGGRGAFCCKVLQKYMRKHVISRSLLHHHFWTSIRWLDLALWLFSVLPIAGQHENLEVCASSRKQKVLRADDLQTSALHSTRSAYKLKQQSLRGLCAELCSDRKGMMPSSAAMFPRHSAVRFGSMDTAVTSCK